MKEFFSKEGGRYTYIDDIMNLQELSTAFTELFYDCDNFVLSGLQVTGKSISSGFVFINGKIRYCEGTSNVTQWPMFVYERNSIEDVAYADSNDKPGRKVYGCVLSQNVPVSNDPITGMPPQAIQINQDGTSVRMKDAFLGKYALLINPSSESQSVDKPVDFNDKVSTRGLSVQDYIELHKGVAKALIQYNETGTLMIQSTVHNKVYKIEITEDGDFNMYTNGTLFCTFNAEKAVFRISVVTPKHHAGNIVTELNDIYNYGGSTDDSALKINMLGHNGTSSYFRDTIIGDGKNKAVFTVCGKTKRSRFDGDVKVVTGNTSIELQHPNLLQNDLSLTSFFKWSDKEGSEMATMGYISTHDNNFHIHTNNGNIQLDNDVYVFGKLYVDNKNVMDVLVDKNTYTSDMSKKANIEDVYSKTESDKTYVTRTEDLSVFVQQAGGGVEGQEKVCKTIGACSKNEFKQVLTLSKAFSDVASYGLPDALSPEYDKKQEERQRLLCKNIGAIYHKDALKTQKDTGWLVVNVKNCGIVTAVYVRQVGHVVSIQGELHTHHDGVIFTLPNSIDPPKYKIGYSHNKTGKWHCVINGGSRECVVDYCSAGCSEYIGFLMTYLV